MAVDMKRSTKMAPESLSTSYLIGSERIEISMITLKSLGKSLPAGMLLKPIFSSTRQARHYKGQIKILVSCMRKTW